MATFPILLCFLINSKGFSIIYIMRMEFLEQSPEGCGPAVRPRERHGELGNAPQAELGTKPEVSPSLPVGER